jgi:hypothetical protein
MDTPVTPNAILQLGTAFFGSRTLLSAVGLGVFTELAAGPLDGETLRLRLGLHDRAASDFFDALVALRMLERTDEGYANAPASALYLDRNKPSYVGAWLEMADRRLFRIWDSLTAAMKSGRPQNEFGDADPFAAMYANAAALESFAKEMTAVSLPVASALAEAFPWQRYETFIDIGAMQGAVPVLLAKRWPHLAGGGFDLPQVRPIFEAYVSTHGLGGRLQFHPGDFRREPLPAAAVLIMGHILVDWDLSMKKQLLQRAYAALPKGGALVIYDMLIDDDRRENAMALLMSLNMLIETAGGGTYTGADCIGWMRSAGFADVTVSRLPAAHSMLVGIK